MATVCSHRHSSESSAAGAAWRGGAHGAVAAAELDHDLRPVGLARRRHRPARLRKRPCSADRAALAQSCPPGASRSREGRRMCWREDRADNMRDGGRWSRRPPPTRGEVITLTNCPGRTPPEGAGEHPPCLSNTERLWNNVQGRLGAPARPAPGCRPPRPPAAAPARSTGCRRSEPARTSCGLTLVLLRVGKCYQYCLKLLRPGTIRYARGQLHGRLVDSPHTPDRPGQVQLPVTDSLKPIM